MKFTLPRFVLASALAGTLALGVEGCSQSYHSNNNMARISLHPEHHTVQVGSTVWVHATTLDLTNSKLHWKVSPTTAKIMPDDSRGNQEARFSASQPGGYMVTAYAKNDGQWVVGRTSITVMSQGNQ